MKDPMMAVVNALAALTAALQDYTEQTAEGYRKTFEPLGTTETPPQEEKHPITFEEVRRILSEKSRAGYTEDIRAAILSCGADKLSEVKPENYEKLLKEVEAIGNAG